MSHMSQTVPSSSRILSFLWNSRKYSTDLERIYCYSHLSTAIKSFSGNSHLPYEAIRWFRQQASEALPLLKEMNFEPFLKGNAGNSTKTSRRWKILLGSCESICDKREALYRAISFTFPQLFVNCPSKLLAEWRKLKTIDNTQKTLMPCLRKKLQIEDFLHVSFIDEKTKEWHRLT